MNRNKISRYLVNMIRKRLKRGHIFTQKNVVVFWQCRGILAPPGTLLNYTPLVCAMMDAIAVQCTSELMVTHLLNLTPIEFITELLSVLTIHTSEEVQSATESVSVCIKTMRAVAVMCAELTQNDENSCEMNNTVQGYFSSLDTLRIIINTIAVYGETHSEITRIGLDAIYALIQFPVNLTAFYQLNGDDLVYTLLQTQDYRNNVPIVRSAFKVLMQLATDNDFVTRICWHSVICETVLSLLGQHCEDGIVLITSAMFFIRILEGRAAVAEKLGSLNLCRVVGLFFVENNNVQLGDALIPLWIGLISLLTISETNIKRFEDVKLFESLQTFLESEEGRKTDVSLLTSLALKRGDAVMLSTILGAKHYPELEGGITLLDIDMPDEDGITPLTKAYQTKNYELARALIVGGAHLHKPQYGQTPLRMAWDSGDLSLVELTIQHSVIQSTYKTEQINLNDTHLEDGSSILLNACRDNHPKLYKLLIEREHLDTNTPDLNGLRPIDVVKDERVLALLKHDIGAVNTFSRFLYAQEGNSQWLYTSGALPNFWRSNICYKTDQFGSVPTDIFVLFRNWNPITRSHLICKVYLDDNGVVNMDQYTKRTEEINLEFRRLLFGDMTYTTKLKPRYIIDMEECRINAIKVVNAIIKEHKEYLWCDFIELLNTKLCLQVIRKMNTPYQQCMHRSYSVYDLLPPETAEERGRIRRDSLDVEEFVSNMPADSRLTANEMNRARYWDALQTDDQHTLSLLTAFGYRDPDLCNDNGLNIHMLAYLSEDTSLIDFLLHIFNMGHVYTPGSGQYIVSCHPKTMGQTVLHVIAQRGSLLNLENYLSRRNWTEMVKDERGYVPLHYAVERGETQMAIKLLKLTGRMEMNAQNNRGYTPLCIAVSNGYDEIVKYLCNHRVDVTIADMFNRIPMDYLRGKPDNNEFRNIRKSLEFRTAQQEEDQRSVI